MFVVLFGRAPQLLARRLWRALTLLFLSFLPSCMSDAEGGQGQGGQFRFGFGFGPSARHGVGGGGSANIANNFAISLPGGATDFVHITPHDVALDHTARLVTAFRVFTDSQPAGDVLYSKDNDSTQRTVGLDLNTCVGGVCGVRLYWCQALNACGRTRLTGTGAFPNARNTMIGVMVDNPRNIGLVYVDGAASVFTTSGAIETILPSASTSRHTWGAKDNGTGAFETDMRIDDIYLWIDPSDIGLNAWSTCLYELNNDRGSRSLPSSCPTPTVWCRGGDDDAGSGTTCTNAITPGTYDLTLSGSAAFVATGSEFDQIPQNPAVSPADRLVQAGMCFPGQSNCGTTAQAAIADLGASQTDEYPNFDDIRWFKNDGYRWTGTDVPQPIDQDDALQLGFVRIDNVGVWTDDLTDANDADNADVSVFSATDAVNDYIAFAMPIVGTSPRFDYLRFDYLNGTAGVGGVCAWEYWNGSAWTAVSGLSDATTCFTAAVADGRVVTWTHPTDWATTTLDGVTSHFVRARVTTEYTTDPVVDQIFAASQSNRYNASVDANPGVSPLVPLCDELLEDLPSHECGIISSPRGGSAIAGATSSNTWLPQFGTQESRLWGEAAHRASDDIDPDTEIGWIMVYQGEAEVNEAMPLGTFPSDWHTWNHRYRMVAVLESLRDYLNNRALPVCIVIHKPTPPPAGYDSGRWLQMRQGLAWVATQMNDVVTVQMPDGFEVSGDEVHQNAAGADLIGRACADALMTTRWFQEITP